jgi:formyl-CoA transferase
LGEDPTLADGDARTAREDELDGAISAWTSQRTAPEAVELLAAAGVPVGPVYDAAAITQDEHFRERRMLRPLKIVIDGEPEEIRFPGVVPRLPGAPGDVRWAGPDLGAHTDEILTGLGYSAERIDDLRAKAVI